MSPQTTPLLPRVRNGAVTSLIATFAAFAAPAVASAATAGVSRIVETSESDTNADGAIDFSTTTTTELDFRGLRLSTDSVVRGTDSEIILNFAFSRFEYNDQGRLVLEIEERGSGDTVESRQFSEYEYDKKGDLARIAVQTDSDGDGDIDSTQIKTITTTSPPLVTVETDARDFDGDGVNDQFLSITRSFDKRGNRIGERTETDNDADGVADSIVAITYTYTNRGSLQTQTTLVTEGGITSSDFVRIDYDTRGLLIGFTQESEPDGNRTTGVVTRDALGNFVSSIEQVDLGGDGTLDEERTETRIRDERGREIESTYTSISFNDATQSFKYLTLNEYDQRGNPVWSVTDTDIGADGLIEYRDETANIHDQRGRVLQSKTTSDYGADGHIDYILTETTTYGRDGERASSITEIDYDGDGVIDSRYIYTRALD